MWSPADPRRTDDARNRGRPIDRGAVHGQAAGAVLPRLEDILTQIMPLGSFVVRTVSF